MTFRRRRGGECSFPALDCPSQTGQHLTLCFLHLSSAMFPTSRTANLLSSSVRSTAVEVERHEEHESRLHPCPLSLCCCDRREYYLSFLRRMSRTYARTTREYKQFSKYGLELFYIGSCLCVHLFTLPVFLFSLSSCSASLPATIRSRAQLEMPITLLPAVLAHLQNNSGHSEASTS